MVLHGGTGLTEAQFTDLIARGCAKVNISTALKIAFVDAHREYLDANPGKHDPPALLAHVRAAVKDDGRATTSASSARPGRRRRRRRRPASRVPALIFDCDGVLADTERDGHRPAFNQTFAEVGPRRSAGRRRSTPRSCGSAAARSAWPRCSPTSSCARNGLPADPEGQKELLADWHKRKTATYKEMVARRASCPAAPAIARIVDEALAAGWTLAVASTSAEESVRAVLEHAVGDRRRRALRGLRRRRRAGQEARPGDLPARARAARASAPDDAIVVEDSRNGLLAAVGAGPALRRDGQRLHGATRT